MLEILRGFIKIYIDFCKFSYLPMIFIGLIFEFMKFRNDGNKILLCGLLNAIISEIIAPILGIC